jgi:hypothetical protein
MIEKPDNYFINRLRTDAPCLFNNKIHKGARKVTELNLLNIDDYIANWEVLDDETRSDVRTIVEGNWINETDDYNRSGGGIKNKSDYPLAEQLLLYAGLGIRDMVRTAWKIIPSNVRDNDGYRNPQGTSLGFIDPRAATKCIREFFDENAPNRLMPHYVCTRVLFKSDPQHWMIGDRTDLGRDRFNHFYNRVAKRLARWHKAGSIKSCLARYEISVSNLAGSIFKPHAHAVIWHTPDHKLRFLNNSFNRGEIEEIQDPQYRWDDIKRYIKYMFQVSPFTNRYRIEWDELNREAMNQLSRKCLWKLIELHIHPGAEVNKDREFKRNLPPHGRGKYY